MLGSVEQGIITLIGATTENPSFEVIPALRSRMRIFKLNELTEKDITSIISSALKDDPVLSQWKVDIPKTAFDYLYFISAGDARSALNIVEAVVNSSPGR